MKTSMFVWLCAAVVWTMSFPAGGEEPTGVAAPPPKATKGKAAVDRSADEAAIRQSAAAFREAFNRGDAKGVAALWTAEGDYIDEEGQRFQGREAIEQEYAKFFAEQPGVKISVLVDSVRVLGNEAAIEDGRSNLEPAPEGAPAMCRYTAVHVKTNGKWLISNVRDSRVEIPSSYGHLQDLEPLIGAWSSEEHDGKMAVTCRWLPNKNFIERKYSVQESGRESASGVQLIGWDPLQQRIQSWTFTSDGGYALGVWSPREKGWAVASKGVMADGATSTSVNVVTFLDRDAVTWQSVERSAGGVRLPDLEEVLLKRVKKER